MPITEGEEWTPELTEAFRTGLIDLEVNNMMPAFQMYGVPNDLIEKVRARCHIEGSIYAGEFMLNWMKGQRTFPELESTK